MSEKELDEIVSEYNFEVNLAIGTGELPVELDLEAFAEEMGVDYDPEKTNPGVDIRTQDKSLPMNTFHRSGKFILRTPDEESLYEEHERTLDKFVELGVISEDEADEIELNVSNLVCEADVGTHFKLSPLAVGLDFKHAEYEPEQFPAVIYKSDEYDCTFSVFASGKIIFAGGSSTEDSIRYLDKFIDEQLSIWM